MTMTRRAGMLMAALGLALAAWAVPRPADAGLNGDGDPDVVFSNTGGRNRVCTGGSAGFACSDVSIDTFQTLQGALADFDQDGNLDAIFANAGEKDRVCFGDGSLGFTCDDVSTDARSSTSVAARSTSATESELTQRASRSWSESGFISTMPAMGVPSWSTRT